MARTDPRPHYGKKRRVRSDGYVDVYKPDHPLARRDGYVFEHRQVFHDAGNDVPSGYQVHHVNGVRDDNALENLALIRGDDHTRLHAPERRASHCPQGHEFTDENTAYNPNGWRYCKQCNRDRARAVRLRAALTT